jgi:hypothetical protein
MRIHLWMLAFCLMVDVGGRASAAQGATPISVAEQYLFSAANAERTLRGLKPLRWDESLYRAADRHAQEMVKRETISHQFPNEPELATRVQQAGLRFSVVAENVAESPSAVRIHDAWMQSPGHRANLLDPNVDAVGIRVLRREGQLYAVEDFARLVVNLSLEEQETAVEAAMQAVSSISILPSSEEPRETCGMTSGFAGAWQPGFVMRYTDVDLTKLPTELKKRLDSGRYREAAVGACEVKSSQTFTTYSIAVLLFP